MKWLAMASAAVFCMGAGAASGQESADVLHVSGQADFLQSRTGGTGVVEWFRTAERHGVQLGAQSGSMADAWWTYGRAGGFMRRRGAVFSGRLEAGGGRQRAEAFGYQRVSAEAAAPVARGRVVLETEGQLARVANDVSRVLRLGVKWQLSNAVAASGGYYLLSHDRSASPAVCARLDLEYGRASILGGVVLARSAEPAVLLNELGGLPRTSTEFFSGWGIRTASYRLLIVANVAQSSRGPNRVLVSVQVPLRSASAITGTAKQSVVSGIERRLPIGE
jgi:hypothetical protein